MKKIALVLIALLLCAAVGASAEANASPRTFTITISFDDDNENSIDYVNSVLSALPLSNLSLDVEGYIVKTTENLGQEDESAVFSYGLESVTLTCYVNAGEATHLYHIGSAAFAKEEGMTANIFYAAWSQEHPDQAIRSITLISYESAVGLVFLYYDRTEQ